MLCLYWSALDNNLHVNYLFKNTAQTKLVLFTGWERFSSLLFSSVYLHFTRKRRRIDIEAFRLTKCNVKMIFVNNFPCFTTPWTIETWLFILLNVVRTEGLHPVPRLEGKSMPSNVSWHRYICIAKEVYSFKDNLKLWANFLHLIYWFHTLFLFWLKVKESLVEKQKDLKLGSVSEYDTKKHFHCRNKQPL